jgi:hypothetical protein
MRLGYLILAALQVFVVNAGAAGAPAKRIPDPIQQVMSHTLIANAPMKTFNNLNCEIVVFVRVDYKKVQVLRIDPPASRLNATYFVDHQGEIEKHGVELPLSADFFVSGRTVKQVQAQFDFENGKHDLTILVSMDDGKVYSKTRSVDAEFFRDHAEQCLK